MPKDTIGKTITVAIGVCVVCSVFVSSAAVYLQPLQQRNKELDRKTNVLMAAGLLEPGQAAEVDELFGQIETRVVDMATGEFDESVAPESIDERRAVKDSDRRVDIAADKDLAKLKYKAKQKLVYLVRKDGRIERIILPVHGKGLWSTMYGFVALDADKTTIKSLAFYEHGETPGLGGEVDNPKWKALWVDKKAFDQSGSPRIEVIKGTVDADDPNGAYRVDGISGATITARGVMNLVRFWLGEEGYGPLLENLATGGTDG